MTAPPAGALEACPFCGGVQLHVLPPTCNRLSPYDPADRAFPTVRCGCGAEVHGDNWDESCKSAIAAWNRRTHGPALLAALRLREGCQRLEQRWRDRENFDCYVRSDEQFSGVLRGRDICADDLAHVLEESATGDEAASA